MSAEDDILLSAAEDVADGSPVDWQRTVRSHASLQGQLGRLRLMERIAAVHRDLRGDKALPPETVLEARTTTFEPVAGGRRQGHGPLPTRWGPLLILNRIGLGGSGEVYRAHDPALGRDVALKLGRAAAATDAVGETAVRRFLDEARRMARLRHPNVLAVHGADRHDGRAGLWADLVHGKTLEECLAEQGPLGADEAALVGVDVCRALAAVHAAGLVHRDVKTTNIMREHGGRIVLMDFGSGAERIPPDPTSTDEPVSGTPLFMAPEILSGGRADVRSDLYALGVVLYRLVSGRYPVEADSFGTLRRRHERGESVPLIDIRPDLPAAFVQAVSRALAARPETRFATAGEMEHALAGTLGAATAGVIPSGSTAPPRRLALRVMPAVIPALVLLTIAALYVLFRPLPFQAEASFYRTSEGAEERLLEGGRLEPGDRLFLEIRGSRAMHVYVLDEDAEGNVFVLFPLNGLDLVNPLRADQRHRLPGNAGGDARFWGSSSAGGIETISIIASLEPLVDLEKELTRLPHAASEAPPAIAAPAIERSLRGLGRLLASERPGGPATARPLAGVLGRVATRAAGESGVWITQLQLRNPAP